MQLIKRGSGEGTLFIYYLEYIDSTVYDLSEIYTNKYLFYIFFFVVDLSTRNFCIILAKILLNMYLFYLVVFLLFLLALLLSYSIEFYKELPWYIYNGVLLFIKCNLTTEPWLIFSMKSVKYKYIL